MKKKLTVLMLAFTMVFTMLAVTACGGGGQSEEKAEETGYGEGYVFKQGFDLDYRPYSFVDDNGENGGFDVEMAQAVCDYYGWKYEAVPFNWDAKDAELNAGSCDCIWSGFTINGREDDYLWSKPYSDNTQKIMVKKDSGIAALADLAGKKVGVQTATSAYDLLNDEEGQKKLADTFASLEVYDTYTIAITDLNAGAVDAVAVDATRAAEAMANDENLVCLEENLGSEQYGIGFRKDDTELCEKVNAALDALAADGTVAKIAAKYPEIEEYITLGK
ncbi:MAG: transporter substrate-binding domain-containing protein [Mogibacterium sp.]|nr:transporter substrate-binding domain-containing protein [Mogibacterium sp.]